MKSKILRVIEKDGKYYVRNPVNKKLVLLRIPAHQKKKITQKQIQNVIIKNIIPKQTPAKRQKLAGVIQKAKAQEKSAIAQISNLAHYESNIERLNSDLRLKLANQAYVNNAEKDKLIATIANNDKKMIEVEKLLQTAEKRRDEAIEKIKKQLKEVKAESKKEYIKAIVEIEPKDLNAVEKLEAIKNDVIENDNLPKEDKRAVIVEINDQVKETRAQKADEEDPEVEEVVIIPPPIPPRRRAQPPQTPKKPISKMNKTQITDEIVKLTGRRDFKELHEELLKERPDKMKHLNYANMLRELVKNPDILKVKEQAREIEELKDALNPPQPPAKAQAPADVYFTVVDDPNYKPVEQTDDVVQVAFGKKEFKRNGLNTTEINEMMKPFYDDGFLGTIPSDGVKDLKPEIDEDFSFIMNLDDSTKKGSHWISVYVDEEKNKIHYYDSYAEPATKDFKNQMAKILQDKMYMYQLKENKQIHQHDDSKSCGWYAMMFLMKKYLELDGDVFENEEKANDFKQIQMQNVIIGEGRKKIYL